MFQNLAFPKMADLALSIQRSDPDPYLRQLLVILEINLHPTHTHSQTPEVALLLLQIFIFKTILPE